MRKSNWGWLVVVQGAAALLGSGACRDFGSSLSAAGGAPRFSEGGIGGDDGALVADGTAGLIEHGAEPGMSGGGAAFGGSGGGLAGERPGPSDTPNAGASAGEGGSRPEPVLGEVGDGRAGQGGEAPALLGETVVERAPESLSGVTLWLEATENYCVVGPDDRVFSCADRSNAGNDATQLLPAEQPQLAASVINGHDALHFEPTPEANLPDNAHRLVVHDAPSIRLGTSDFTLALVARWKNSAPRRRDQNNYELYSGYGGLVTKCEGGPPYTGLAVWANYPSVFTDSKAWTRFTVQLDTDHLVAFSYSDDLNDNTFRVYLARRTGASLAIHINGSHEGGMKLPNVLNLDALGSDLFIGGQRGQPLDGDIAELVMIKGATTDAEVAGLERHLMNKYALL